MNVESQKAQAFIARLLRNPTLSGMSHLQKEEQIIQFMHGNAAQLAPTLSSGQFFPGKNWNQIFSLLENSLYEVINGELLPDLRRIATEKIDYAFLPSDSTAIGRWRSGGSASVCNCRKASREAGSASRVYRRVHRSLIGFGRSVPGRDISPQNLHSLRTDQGTAAPLWTRRRSGTFSTSTYC